MASSYHRPVFDQVVDRLSEPRGFIQVLAGPRQVGKTTLAQQVMRALGRPAHYASADDAAGRDGAWLESQWDLGRVRARGDAGLLFLDEVQKIPDWSETVKRLWDEDTAEERRLAVMLLGSSPLLVQQGLSESLAGRFEIVRLSHWSFTEMRDAFGWGLDEYLFFGGYPGSAALVDDHDRWAAYIMDSLLETTVSRDILLLTRIHKPALLRQLFRLACDYSGRVLSYTKMLGQLQDAGNTTTLAHYLRLLEGARLATGLPKYSGSTVRRRGSSPKLLVLNTALVSASSGLTPSEARADPDFWGRLVETAVGAHLVNQGAAVSWWRDGNEEVDLVVTRGANVTAIEVTSGRRKSSVPGLGTFADRYEPTRKLLVGGQGIPLEEFLSTPAETWTA